jgi:predicted ATP-grasp superfamily ATP-dependent carboligase
MKVLVTDGSYKNSLAVVRALAIEGHDVCVVGGRYCLANMSRFSASGGFRTAEFGLFGSGLSEIMMGNFVEHVNYTGYDLIIPVGGKSVELISINKSSFNNCLVFLPDHPLIELALDKKKTATLCNSLGIKTPKLYDFDNISDVQDRIGELQFPVVVKSSNELQKFPTRYFSDKDTLLASLKMSEAFRLQNNWAFPIIQQRIQGKGVGYFGVFDNGNVVSQFMHVRIRETPAAGGASSCAKSIFLSELEDQGRRVLKSLKWTGPAMVEFKLNESDGELYFMEINPKLWGSLDLAISCGVNIPADIVSLAGKKFGGEKSVNYIEGKTFSWPLDGELNHILDNPRSIVRVIVDSINPSVASNLMVTDCKPGLLSLMFTVRGLLIYILAKIGFLRLLSLSRKIGFKHASIRLLTEKTGIPIKRYSEIQNLLYVGAQYKDKGIGVLKKWGIKKVICLRAEFDNSEADLNFCNYSYLPVVEFQPLSYEILIDGVHIIKEAISKGDGVYIHCSEGVSRAPTLAAAYLVSMGESVSSAIAVIKKSRPFINILDSQLRALEDFEARFKANDSMGSLKK